MDEKATMSEKRLIEKHPCEDTSLSFHERMCAIYTDNSLSQEQKKAARINLSEHGWVAKQKPPLFTAALSLDSPSDKAAAVEAALRAGADPNELDHDFRTWANGGRALAFFVNLDVHFNANDGEVGGMLNNLPAIEVMLRYGADPRQSAPWITSRNALSWASPPHTGLYREFYEAAWQMMSPVAEALDKRDHQLALEGVKMDPVTKDSLYLRDRSLYEPSILSRLLWAFKRPFKAALGI